MTEAAIPVVCGIIERNDTFLAARRPPHESNANLWEFPGGKLRAGERPEAALARELREELDIEIRISAALTPVTFAYPAKTIRLIPFVCCMAEGEPLPAEHAEIRWISPTDAQSLAWSPADVAVLKEYCRNKK